MFWISTVILRSWSLPAWIFDPVGFALLSQAGHFVCSTDLTVWPVIWRYWYWGVFSYLVSIYPPPPLLIPHPRLVIIPCWFLTPLGLAPPPRSWFSCWRRRWLCRRISRAATWPRRAPGTLTPQWWRTSTPPGSSALPEYKNNIVKMV